VVLDVLDAQRALVTANDDVQATFKVPGEVMLTGPGSDFASQVAQLRRDLDQVSALNDAGPDGIADVESVEGELDAYDSTVEQAASYYSDGDALLGTTTDWEASQLLDSDGLLATLRSLQAAEQDAMNARTSSLWAGPLVVALWVVPSLLMLVGLIAAQAYLARRFRRRLSIPLSLATALLLALAAGGVTVVLAQHRLARASADMTRVTGEQAADVRYSDYQGEVAVGELIGTLCRGSRPAAPLPSLRSGAVTGRQAGPPAPPCRRHPR
jgi:hypothetical protein